MQHSSGGGKLEVDHFDPRKKKDLIQSYDNLFPSTRHCNSKKKAVWPNKKELEAGCRFLNPCREIDYGQQIFEDAKHRLVGITPAAKWHIRMCGLNADHLVDERARRARHWRNIRDVPIQVKHSVVQVGQLITDLRAEVELMIPEISGPPSSMAPASAPQPFKVQTSPS